MIKRTEHCATAQAPQARLTRRHWVRRNIDAATRPTAARLSPPPAQKRNPVATLIFCPTVLYDFSRFTERCGGRENST